MIRIVMFDLGLTLIDEQNRPFAHVPEAVKAISKLKTSDKKPVRCCLVSDFTMATPPITPKKIRPLFEEYLEVLDQTGLRPLFEPVERRVTLSTHANAFKPDRAMFETALRRLRVRATLDECLLITENTAHIKAARTGDTPGLQAGHELGSRTRVKQRGSRIRLPLRGNRRLPRNTHGCLAR